MKRALIGAALAALVVTGTASAFPISPRTCGSKTADPALSCMGGIGATDSLTDVQLAYGSIDKLLDKDDSNADNAFDDFFVTGLDFEAMDFGNVTDGYFFISDDALAAYSTPFVLVLKGGNVAPKWSMFEIDLKSLVSGTGDFLGYSYGLWSSDRQGLSHASLYVGESTGGGGSTAPEPASMALLGVGLLGAANRIRRRKTTA